MDWIKNRNLFFKKFNYQLKITKNWSNFAYFCEKQFNKKLLYPLNIIRIGNQLLISQSIYKKQKDMSQNIKINILFIHIIHQNLHRFKQRNFMKFICAQNLFKNNLVICINKLAKQIKHQYFYHDTYWILKIIIKHKIN